MRKESISEIIQDLDPLSLDDFFTRIPGLNRSLNVQAIVRESNLFLPTLEQVYAYTRINALAALRDLGMIAASIRRHGYEPTEVIQGLGDVLAVSGEIAQNVPRDTVFTYGSWNPVGARQRRFTELPEEELFIDSFKNGMSNLESSVNKLLLARTLDVDHPEFYNMISSASQDFSLMIGAIVAVRRDVPPEIFTGELRPYFDPYIVRGKSYLAPGGAQMPVILIDQIIWGSDCQDKNYQDYVANNQEYLPVELKLLSEQLVGQESLVSRIVRKISTSRIASSQEVNGVLSVRWFAEKLLSFRMPHLAVARGNFALRRDSDVGSGGYNTDILDLLIDKTRRARNKLMAFS